MCSSKLVLNAAMLADQTPGTTCMPSACQVAQRSGDEYVAT